MYEGHQSVLERLPLGNFKIKSFTSLKTSKLQHNKDQYKNIMTVVMLHLLLVFELIHQAFLVNLLFFINF